MNRKTFLTILLATFAFTSMSGDSDGWPKPPPRLARPTIWMGAGENGPPTRSDPDPAEIARLLALMESDDEVERFSAAALWIKETIGPWPHVLAIEHAVQTSSGNGTALVFMVNAWGILDWTELPEDVRRVLLVFVLKEIVRPEPVPGARFRFVDKLLCRFVPDWRNSDARRDSAVLSLGNGVPDENGDFRIDVFRQLDAMNPYDRIHRSLESIRADPLARIPDAGRDSESVRVADAAEYLSRFAFGWIHGGGESADHFFRRKGIGPDEGFKVLAAIVKRTADEPAKSLVRENAILALQFTDVPEAFDYAVRLAETETGPFDRSAAFAAALLAEGNTNRLNRLRSIPGLDRKLPARETGKP